MNIPFVKMHGLGNDYLFIDERRSPSFDPVLAAPRACDRHRGVGGDGIVIHGPPVDPRHHARMRVVNADGSEGGVCGNGLRCLALLLVTDEGVDREDVRIETPDGVVRLRMTSPQGGVPNEVEADMGPPRFEAARIPAVVPGLDPGACLLDRSLVELESVGFDGIGLPAETRLSLVSMGNPHLVLTLPPGGTRADLDREIRRIGPGLEGHSWFPRRINVHLATSIAPDRMLMSTWERGSGPTRACGTGACAAAVAMRRSTAGLDAPDRQEVDLPGGRLSIDWDGGDESSVRQRGPAVEVFRGRLESGIDSEEDASR